MRVSSRPSCKAYWSHWFPNGSVLCAAKPSGLIQLLRSGSALRMWVDPLKWSGLPAGGQDTRPCRIKPLAREATSWRKGERGDSQHSCHSVAPWNLGQKHTGRFCLMPAHLKSSNCSNWDYQRRLKPLIAVSLICWQQCQAQNQILSMCQVSQRLPSPPEGNSWGFMFHQRDER